jgi:hypothetical protein
MSPGRTPSRAELGFVSVAGLAIVLFLYASLFTRPSSFGSMDHDYFNAWQLAVNDSLRHGQLLHWMPHLCGGQPGLGNPQSGVLSPFNVLGLWLSPVMQFKVEMVLNALGGLAGFVALAVWSGASPAVALVGFVIWIGNGLIATRVLHGQSPFLTLLLLPPLVALMYREALEPGRRWPRLRGVVWGAAVLLLILYQDGFHTLIHAMPLLVTLALGWLSRGRGTAPLAWLVSSGLVAGMLSLPRVLPAAMFVRETPRLPPTSEFVTVAEEVQRLIDPDLLGQVHDIVRRGNLFELGHLGHVGLVPLALFLFFLLRKTGGEGGGEPPRWPWFIAFALGFALALGDLGPLSPWHHLRALPLFKMIRAPYKFHAGLALAVACGAQLAVSRPAPAWLQDRVPDLRARGGAVLAVLVLSLVAMMAASLWPLFDERQQPYQPPFDRIDASLPFVNARVDSTRMYTAVANNVDVVNCYEPTTRHSLVPPRTPLAALASGLGEVHARIEPNGVVVSYEAPTDDVLLVFQNWDAAWVREPSGEPVARHPVGFMEIPVQAGPGQVVLRYRPVWFHLGLAWSGGFAALLGALAGWRAWRKRPLTRKGFHDQTYCFVDTPHSRDAVHQQINGGKMDGFVLAAQGTWKNPVSGQTEPVDPTRVMTYYTKDDIPLTYWLAQNFSIGDRYFCSAPTSTGRTGTSCSRRPRSASATTLPPRRWTRRSSTT